MIYKNICFKFGSFFKISLTVSNVQSDDVLEKKSNSMFLLFYYKDLINQLIISKEISIGDDFGKTNLSEIK